MKSIIKRASLFLIIMLTILMMSITYAVSFVSADFDLDNIPKIVSLHLGENIILPSDQPIGEYGGWEIVSGSKYAQIQQGRLLELLKTGTVKVTFEANDGTKYLVSIKILNHKYDKKTDYCSCGARRPVSSLKFKETSFAFDQKDTTIEMSKYLTVKPVSTVSNVDWYVSTNSSWYGGSIASINMFNGNLSIDRSNMGTGTIRAVDYVSGKEARVPFAVFDSELLSQYTLCLGENIVLPIAERGARWEIASGDNRLKEGSFAGNFEGIKTGSAKLVYSTDVGDFKTTIKVVKHKFNKKTGECTYCGVKQPPKKFEFNESTYILGTGEYDLSSTKYLNLQPTNADVNINWYMKTFNTWYESDKTVLKNDGTLKVKAYDGYKSGYGKITATDKISGAITTFELIIDSDPIEEKYVMCVGNEISLPYARYGDYWEVVSGDKYVNLFQNSVEARVEALKAGTAKLEYTTPAGNVLKSTIKVQNHKYNKTTGECSCGAKQPPKKFEFNESTYILGTGEYDLNSTKYLNLQPTGANVDLRWYMKTYNSWYVSELNTLNRDGILKIVTYNGDKSGYGMIKVTDEISGAETSFELIIDNDPIEEKYTIHVGDKIYLPNACYGDYWEVTTGSKYVNLKMRSIDATVEGLAKGTAKLKYVTPAGNVIKTTVKVENHKYDRNGVCSCGDEIVSISQDIIDVLDEYDIMLGYPDGSFRAGTKVTRADVARYLVNVLSLAEEAEEMRNETYCSDVSLKDGESYAWVRGYVNLGLEKGFLSTYPDGTFRPEKEVTIAEFLTMVLRVLGYGDIVELEGTWPTNVILKCKELELLENVQYIDSQDSATRGVVATVLYNALYTPMWEEREAGEFGQSITLEEYAFTGVDQFVVLTSNGLWNESSSSGVKSFVGLVNETGAEYTYIVLDSTLIGLKPYRTLEDFEGEYFDYLLDNTPLFFWADLNTDGEIEDIENLLDCREYGDYSVYEFNSGLDDDNYLDGEYKVTSSTVIFKAIPIKNANNEIVKINVEVSKGLNSSLDGIESGLVAHKIETPRRAEYVFISETRSENVNFGLVERLRTSHGINYITINGEEYEITDESNMPEVGDFVAYTLNADVVTITEIIKSTDVDDEMIPMVEKLENGIIYLSDGVTIDVDRNTTIAEYKNITFVLVSADLNSDDVVEFDADVEVLGRGIENATLKKGDRVFFDKIKNVVVIVRGLDEMDVILDGALVPQALMMMTPPPMMQQPVEEPVEEPTEEPAEESTEEPAEEPVEEPTEEPVEEPAEEPAEEPTEEPVEEPTEEPAEEPTEEPAEEPTEEPVEEPTEEPAEEPVEEPTEEPVEEPAEEPTEEPTEEPVEEPAEEPVEEPTEEPTEELAEELVEESAEELVK